MKQYILTERMLNGTVTMSTVVLIVKAENFQDATNKVVKKLKGIENLTFNVEDNVFGYYINDSTSGFRVCGRMENKEAEYLIEVEE